MPNVWRTNLKSQIDDNCINSLLLKLRFFEHTDLKLKKDLFVIQKLNFRLSSSSITLRALSLLFSFSDYFL